MQPKHAEKTESAHKYRKWVRRVNPVYLWVLVLGIVISAFVVAWFVSRSNCPLRMKGQCVALERVSTQEARAKGLSGREGLAVNEGMLFVFETPGQHCFWMKDMRFDIDMIWLDSKKEIISIRENVAPSSYPSSFCPDTAAQFVLELRAGSARDAGLWVGQRIPVR